MLQFHRHLRSSGPVTGAFSAGILRIKKFALKKSQQWASNQSPSGLLPCFTHDSLVNLPSEQGGLDSFARSLQLRNSSILPKRNPKSPPGLTIQQNITKPTRPASPWPAYVLKTSKTPTQLHWTSAWAMLAEATGSKSNSAKRSSTTDEWQTEIDSIGADQFFSAEIRLTFWFAKENMRKQRCFLEKWSSLQESKMVGGWYFRVLLMCLRDFGWFKTMWIKKEYSLHKTRLEVLPKLGLPT